MKQYGKRTSRNALKLGATIIGHQGPSPTHERPLPSLDGAQAWAEGACASSAIMSRAGRAASQLLLLFHDGELSAQPSDLLDQFNDDSVHQCAPLSGARFDTRQTKLGEFGVSRHKSNICSY